MRTVACLALLPALSALSLAACAVDPSDAPLDGTGGTPTGAGGTSGAGGAPASAPVGLHVVGNHLEDGQGQTIAIRGVNRSGTEYMCIQGHGIFDGPSDEASVRAISSWKANAVRVPLNESCWLGINGAPALYSGANYKAAIGAYVSLLHKYGLIPIIELHWIAPGALAATRQQPMPDVDHTPAFWTDVATLFGGDDGVIFEPYNEPFPDGNKDSVPAWQCWRDGCTANLAVATGTPAATYAAVGLQALVTAIRDTGARNVILLGGVQYSNTLTQWLAYKPTDPLDNLGAAWHAYNFNACNTQGCWDAAPAMAAAAVPLVATEFGQRDCMSTFVTPLMSWFDAHGVGYLAWSWNAYGACMPYVSRTQTGQPWSLITSYSGNSNGGYAQAVHDHLASF
jgi:endoglucanase